MVRKEFLDVKESYPFTQFSLGVRKFSIVFFTVDDGFPTLHSFFLGGEEVVPLLHNCPCVMGSRPTV